MHLTKAVKFIRSWNILESATPAFNMLDDYLYGKKFHEALDYAVCNIRVPNSLFFKYGWGDVSIPKLFYELIQEKAINRDRFMLPNKIDIEWIKRYDDDEVTIAAGQFETPNPLIASHLPKESKKAYIQFVIPRSWEDNNYTGPKPVAIILPGTAEEGFERRRDFVSYPLAARGVATILLEGPYYGYRRPKTQSYFRLSHVSDLPCLGFATIEESCSLIRWLNDNGYGPVALAGNSMGGLHSAMVSAVSPFPVGCSSWLGPPSAVPVFTRGILRTCVSWNDLLKDAKKRNILPWLEKLHCLYPIKYGKDEPMQELLSKFLAMTDLEIFPKPVIPEAVHLLCAKDDLYIPHQYVRQRMENIAYKQWKCTLKYMPGGHVSSYLFQRGIWNKDLIEVLQVVGDITGKKVNLLS